MKHKENRILE